MDGLNAILTEVEGSQIELSFGSLLKIEPFTCNLFWDWNIASSNYMKGHGASMVDRNRMRT